MPGDELFVCGDHRLTRRQRFPDPLAGRFKAADEFDDDMRIGRKNIINISVQRIAGDKEPTRLRAI
jgi:hypothetical protein